MCACARTRTRVSVCVVCVCLLVCIYLCIYIYIRVCVCVCVLEFWARSAGGCRIRRLHFCRRIRPLLPNKCSGSDTKLHLMVNLQSWSGGKCGEPLYYHKTPRSTLTQSSSTCESSIYGSNHHHHHLSSCRAGSTDIPDPLLTTPPYRSSP